jgi:hypothetical protein
VYNVTMGDLPRRHDLTYLPTSVVVRFDKLRLRERLPQTATANDVTIVPDTVSFVYEGFGGKKTMRRTQLPLTPCQSMTVPMVQGKTLGHYWVDLNVDDAPGHKMTCLYVMISRATDLGNVRLLQPFHHGQLHRSRDSAIRNDELRLLQIESSTLQQFIRSHPDLAGGVFADATHSHAARSQPTQTAKRARERSSDDLGVCVCVCVRLCVCCVGVHAVNSISHCFSCTADAYRSHKRQRAASDAAQRSRKGTRKRKSPSSNTNKRPSRSARRLSKRHASGSGSYVR